MRNIHAQLLRAIESGEQLALATLIETKGSTPQITGASALFSPDGLRAGTLGGGLLEAEGELHALRSLRSGLSVMYNCGLMSEISDPAGAICGGSAVVLIDVHPERHVEAFREMTAALDRNLPGALLTCIGRIAGDDVLVKRDWVTATESGAKESGAWYDAHAAEIADAIAERKPVTLRMGESSSAQALFSEREPAETVTETVLYVEPAYPLPQLIITGAGHIGRSLAHYGRLLDFEVTVIDDRPELTNSANIPDADHFIVGEVGEAVSRLTIHKDSYIVIVNRGHRGDTEALRQCIGSDAAYIGMIGSTRKIAQVRTKFLQEGWSNPGQFDRIHAPIGLSIDAKTVEEIGISIAAELVAERRGRLRGKTAA
jgi:xanthine dehydrogenase accessory factor